MSARTTFHPQSHAPTDMSQFSEPKKRLVQMMDVFTTAGDRVNPTEEQLELAGQLVQNGDQTRYAKVPFGSIIHQNQGQDGQMEMMVTAFDVLFRYTVNMLKLKRPRNWHTIKFSNANFKARADCMVGTRYILNLMGYTKPIPEDGPQIGLSYPEPAVVDTDMIKIIGTELLTAKVEVKAVQESRGNFNYPLPLARVQLESHQPTQPPKHPQLDDMYSSNVRPVQQLNPTESGSPMGSGSFGSRSSQYSGDSHHSLSHNNYQPPSGNSNLSHHSSYQLPSTSGNYQSSPDSSFGVQQHINKPPGSSYGQGNIQPRSNQQYDYQNTNQSGYGQGSMQPQGSQQMDYQRSNESGYQSRHQSSGQSSETASTTGVESSQPNSTERHLSIAAKLAALKKKKEGILETINQSAQGGGSAYPSSTTSQFEPPVATATTQPSIVPPSSNAPAQPQRPPVKPRTRILVPSSDVKHSEESDLSALHEGNSQAQKVPAQRPPVQKRGPRTMMECDYCGFLNHEKCQVCVDCENSRNDRWREVRMPNRDGSTDKQQATPPNAQYNGQPSSVGSAQSSTPNGAAGASGTSTPKRELKDFVPVVNYTPEEKEEIKKQQLEKDRLLAQQQQQGMDGGGAEAAPLTSFMPKNDQYNLDTGERPTGNVLFNVSDVVEPENAELYKNLGNQGRDLIQDIKVGLLKGFQLEEIQLATKLQHGYQRPCDFLTREWSGYIEKTMFQAGQYSDEEHRKRRMNGSIGRPNRNEIVKVLIEEGGDRNRAAQKCCMNRMKMIQHLMSELELPQSQAVLALERNDLDVDKAIRAVYYDKINNAQLYDYIWGTLKDGGIRKAQNERVGQMITGKSYNDHYLHRLLMAEYKLPTTNHCEVLVHLVRECSLTLGACLDVAKIYDDVETAKRLLTQECPICTLEHMRDEMIAMVHCDDAVCKSCFIEHFTLIVGEKSIKHFNCPCCREPDMSSETIDMDLYLQMFSGLIQAHLAKDNYDLFTQKLNEHAMIKNPNFRWCIKCSTGFINEGGRKMVQCPNGECGQQTCFHCKKPWEPAHDRLSCEQFAKWKQDNDPELQAQGLAAYLNEEGIECPSCGFKYALAKGGCMHFKCTQCPAEFCSGCGGLFKKDCVKYGSCRNKGLHAHHPRDCLFYLRDLSVDDLQKLLNDSDVQFDIDPPKGQVDAETAKGIQALQGQADDKLEQPAPVAAPAIAAPPVLKCRVMLQKENPKGAPIDQECGDPVESGHAGLCEKHYKEYLVYKINQNNIDPLPLCTEPGPLRAMLLRDEKNIPDQQAGETEEQYCERLRQCIKDELPLQERKALNF